MVTVCNRLCNPLFERSAQSRQGCKPCNPVFCIALRYEPDGKLYIKSDKYIKRENYWVTRVTEQKNTVVQGFHRFLHRVAIGITGLP